MGPKTAEQLIAMALDVGVSKEEFSDAFFLHYVPSGEDGLEQLLYTIAIHRAELFIENGIDLAYITQTADLIHATHALQIPRTAS